MSSVMMACAEEEKMNGLGYIGSLGLTAAQKAAQDEKKAANAAAAIAKKKAAADAAEAKRQANIAAALARKAASNLPPAEKRVAVAAANKAKTEAVKAINKAKTTEVKAITEIKKAAVADAKADIKDANVKAAAAKKELRRQGKTMKLSERAAPVADALSKEIDAAKKKNQDLRNKLNQIKAKPPRKAPVRALRGLGWFGGRLGTHTRRAGMARRQRRGMGSCCSGFMSEMGLGDIDPTTGQETGTTSDNSYLIEKLKTDLAAATASQTTACAKRPTAPKCLYAKMETSDKEQMLFMIQILDQINQSNAALMEQILQLLQASGTAPCYDASGNPMPCAPTTGGCYTDENGQTVCPQQQYTDPYTGQPIYATPQGYVQPGYDPYGPQMVSGPDGGGYDPYGGQFIDTSGSGILPVQGGYNESMVYGGADSGGGEIVSSSYYEGPTYDGGESGNEYESDSGLEYGSEEATPAPSYAARSRQIIRDPYMEESQMSTRDSGPTFDTIVDQEMADEGGGYDDGGDWN